MRRVVVGCLLSAVLAVPVASGDDHQTATVEVAVGAEVEILPRIPELAAVEGPGPHFVTAFRPDTESPGSMRSGSGSALSLGTVPGDDPIRLNSLFARVRAQALASNGSALATVTARPSFDWIHDLHPDLDRLCRAGRADSAPVCHCARNAEAGQQRCAFSFLDFQVAQLLPALASAGEPVQVEWTIHPSVDGGDYWFEPEIFADGTWVRIASKQKLGGKFAAGRESQTKLTFAMPKNPTLLRTRMYHQPKDAKQPVESRIDTVIDLRKPKPQ